MALCLIRYSWLWSHEALLSILCPRQDGGRVHSGGFHVMIYKTAAMGRKNPQNILFYKNKKETKNTNSEFKKCVFYTRKITVFT